MKRIYAVVAEFNPFHNGHKALVDHAKQDGGYVVAVMSGNFVQRCEPAVTEKRVRTQAALACGCDLVIELPVSHATATAEKFAHGAISIIKACGCIDSLAFGSESAEPQKLADLAEMTANDKIKPHLAEYLKTGITFAKARQLAVNDIFGSEYADILALPNNLLAVEYLKAAQSLGWNPHILTIKRRGAQHDSPQTVGNFASASYLRKSKVYEGFVPAPAKEIYDKALAAGLWPINRQKLNDMQFSYLRRLSLEDLKALPDLSEGIHSRAYNAIRSGVDIEDICQKIKTKRYPMSRVRRLLLTAFLGIRSEDVKKFPPYIRILGMNHNGREILSYMKKNATLPFDTSFARLREINADCRRAVELECLSTDMFTTALPSVKPCGWDFTAGSVILGKSNIV